MLVYSSIILKKCNNVCASHVDDENCASVWSFPVYSPEDYAANTGPVDLNDQSDQGNLLQDS